MDDLAKIILNTIGCESNCCFTKWIGFIAFIYITSNILHTIWTGLKLHFLSRFLPLGEDLSKYSGWVLITGATDGIGLEYARQLAVRGKKLIIVGRNAEKLQRVEAELMEKYFAPQVKTLRMDFANDELDGYDKMRDEVQGLQVDILINNVGVGIDDTTVYHKVKPDLIWKQIHTNMTSAVIMNRMFLSQMEKRKTGIVINIASMAGRLPQGAHGVVYGQTKCFLIYLSRAMAQEYPNLIIQTVCPGIVLTKMVKPFERMEGFQTMAVSAPIYVDSVIRQIGVCGLTAGHWWHALQQAIVGSFPEPMFHKYMKDARKDWD